jgi:hypothetical protein
LIQCGKRDKAKAKESGKMVELKETDLNEREKAKRGN